MEFVEPLRRMADIARFREEMRRRGPRDLLLFELGTTTGLRVSDLLALRVADVTVRTGKTWEVGERVRIREQKTAKRRDVILHSRAVTALRAYLRERLFSFDEPLFLSRSGEGLRGTRKSPRAISRVQAWRILRKAAAAAGITEPVGTHTLRKTFAYRMLKSGVGVERVQRMLNHGSPAVTLAYCGITQDEMDELCRGLDI